MSTFVIPYAPTTIAPSGGTNAYAGTGMTYAFTLSLTGTSGGEVTIVLTDVLTGVQTQLGFGYATSQVPIMCFTFNQKVYVLAGSETLFSAIADPTTWNNPSGNYNGFVTISNFYSTQRPLTSMATYQGRLAFFTDWAIIIFIIDPNPANWQVAQTLTNIGTFATQSLSSLGDLDVLFLAYTGYRSLRVRDSSLNAYVNDIGSPVDSFVQNDIAQSGITTASAACSITDPQTGRYWGFIPNTSAANGVGNIYVLSFYPSSKIEAWSTYDPSYISGGNTAYFTPTKFLVYNGQVYARGSDGNLYQYGAADGNTYDTVTATVTIPFMDAKRPNEVKKAMALDADLTGNWELLASSDWIGGNYEHVSSVTQATFDQGFLAWSAQGTHLGVKVITSQAAQAQLTTLCIAFEGAEEPAR